MSVPATRQNCADVFTAALAKRHKADLVSADPEFRAVEKKTKVSWLTA